MPGARVVSVCVSALGVAILAGSCGSEALPEASLNEQPSSTPSSASTPIPSGRPFELYTHCGVESARIDGRWWHAKPPLYNNSRSSPPAGWGDPSQRGTLTMVSNKRALFVALGQRVVFVPAPNNEPVRMCD
jgi:hypothetical protein